MWNLEIERISEFSCCSSSATTPCSLLKSIKSSLVTGRTVPVSSYHMTNSKIKSNHHHNCHRSTPWEFPLFLAFLWLYLIVQLKRWQETGWEKGRVTRSKGTWGRQTQGCCSEDKASVHGTQESFLYWLCACGIVWHFNINPCPFTLDRETNDTHEHLDCVFSGKGYKAFIPWSNASVLSWASTGSSSDWR